MVGLEPTSLTAADFKSAVFTISPHGHYSFIIPALPKKSTKKVSEEGLEPSKLGF